MRTRASTAWLAATLTLGLSACGGGEDTFYDGPCTTEVRTSILVTVVDQNASAIPSASIAYQINGGPVRTVACPATGACPIAQEQAGRFTLSVSKTGFETRAVEVQVSRDVCHVQTEQRLVILRAIA